MAIKIINPIEDDRWDSFIFSQEQSTIYHHSAWKKVLEKTYRHIHPLYFINENSNNELEAAIPTCLVNSIMTGKRLVSLPFSTRCNPLGKNENQLRETILAVNSETKRLNAQYVEFRMSGHQLLFDKIAVGSCSHYLTHILSLDRTKEDIFNSFHRSMIKQKVRKADRFGLKLIAGKNQTDINTFYRLYLLTRRKLGLPGQPYDFFTNMWEVLYPKGLMTLLLVEFSGQIVAAIILLKYKDTIYAEYCASDKDFLHVHPNHWLFWKSIEYAIDEGYDYFDFGRSSKTNCGLVNFKKRWGAVEHPLCYYFYPKNPRISASTEDSWKYKTMNTIIKHSPTKITEWSGKILYHHLGG